MAFMIPEYTREPFLTGENRHGEGDACPLSAYMSHNAIKFGTPCDRAMGAFAGDRGLVPGTIEIIRDKWWCRLSAPGYMDCTDWCGPFDTLDQARHEIETFYEVDPDTGEDLEESEL